jgi:hypothetical protein
VIVRLMGEGQYRIDDSLHERLNELDEKAVEALERNDEAALDGYLEQMAGLVRSEGQELPLDDLHPSDLLIPPADLTLEETRQLFSDDGLISDLPTAPA